MNSMMARLHDGVAAFVPTSVEGDKFDIIYVFNLIIDYLNF